MAHRPKCAMPDQANRTFGIMYVIVSLAKTVVGKPKTAQNDPSLAKQLWASQKQPKIDPDVI